MSENCNHDAETFFNFPALSIEFQDMLCIVFQVSADGIIAIEGLFFGDAFSIYAVDVFISNFTLWRDALFCNEPFIVILICLADFLRIFFHRFDGPFNLGVADGSLIVLVLHAGQSTECFRTGGKAGGKAGS